MVFVPSYIRGGFYNLDVTQVQEFTILFLGCINLFTFLIMEKKMKKDLIEKNKIQGQVNSMSRDLKYSYSYIGEINRKLDILENIALGYPESSRLTQKNETELYDSIMDAIKLFGKSDKFSLRFIHLPNCDLIKEFGNVIGNSPHFSFKGSDKDISYKKSNDFIIIMSPKSIDNIFSYIIIEKKTSSQKIDDLEMMKTLASQALFLFVFMRNKKQIKCVI